MGKGRGVRQREKNLIHVRQRSPSGGAIHACMSERERDTFGANVGRGRRKREVGLTM